MKVRELIAAHTNTDFDAFAAMVAAHKLYPGAAISLGGAVNRNVREFQALYADLVPVVDPADVDLDGVRRLVLVDTVHANRLGELAPLCERDDVQVVAFDHHEHDAPPAFIRPENLVTGATGSLVTLMLRIITERAIPVTPFEATVFALGIHEDTGSLTFSTTTPDDAEALAFCMRHGADAALLEKWLTNALTVPQRRTLAAALDVCEDIGLAGVSVLVAALREELYVEGVSVVAHRIMDLTGCDAFFLLVAMENRVFVTARSRGGRVDVAEALAAVGGGGHTAAASAVVKDRSLDAVRRDLQAAIGAAVAPVTTVGDAMVAGLHAVGIDETVDSAAIACRRLEVDGLAVIDGDRVAGTVSLADLDRAAGHGLGHAPVKAVMMSRVVSLDVDDTLEHAARVVAETPLGWAPVLRRGARPGKSAPRRSDVAGMLTRAAAAGGRPAGMETPREAAGNLAGRLAELGLDEVLEQIQAVAAEARGVFLVGGAVRDLLLGERQVDLDIAVEGDGIAVARSLAARLKGHVRPHEKFGTAVVVVPGDDGVPLRVDIASTRSESYDYPAALPKVEHATIRSDLARRDFTINAMAVSLKPETYGALLDYFGGRADLEARRIVVLHNLSFIEDPTRILRAIRYENRYGLRMDAHTHNLARACSSMDLVGDLSSARLRDELVLLLDEEKVDFSLRRLEELGLTTSIHGRLLAGPGERALVKRADALRRRHGLAVEVPAWRLRLAVLLRDLEPEEVGSWTRRMRIRRRDADVLERVHVVAERLAERIARGPTEAEVFDLADGQPVEALLVAMAKDETGIVADRLGRFLDVSRHVRLEIDGDDLLAMGMGASPRLGKVLRNVLHLKLNGVVSGREDELAAARLQRSGA